MRARTPPDDPCQMVNPTFYLILVLSCLFVFTMQYLPAAGGSLIACFSLNSFLPRVILAAIIEAIDFRV
jgi:hypothetical protein